jgi:carboxyl-terminal processing protease
MVPKYHLNRVRIDDKASEQLFDRFIDQLDPQKIYFLQSDIDGLSKFRETLDDAVKEGHINFAYEAFDIYRQRLHERLANAQKLIDQDFDFTIDESIDIDTEKAAWAKSSEELDQRWRKRVKYEVLQLLLDDETIDEVRTRLHSRYHTIQLNIEQMKNMEILEIYLTALAECFDPHSSYMSPYTLEDFQISMRLSLDGIGAALRSEDGYTVVAEIVPGGAADKDGRLKVGDKIIGVDKEGKGDVTDIVNMRLTEVVRLIRSTRWHARRLN